MEEIRNCILLDSSNGLISVSMCTDSTNASGFQVIAQLCNANEIQKLYANQSMDPHTPVTVEVERDGLYRVTVFVIREGRGILDSGRGFHTGHVMVTTKYNETTVQDATLSTTTTLSGMHVSYKLFYTISFPYRLSYHHGTISREFSYPCCYRYTVNEL